MTRLCFAFFQGISALFLTASAQLNGLQVVIDRVFDNYFMVDGSFLIPVAESSDQKLQINPSISLQPTDLTAQWFARSLSSNVGHDVKLLDTAWLDAALSVGARGPINFDGSIFDGGFGANDGIYGLTPIVGGSLWLGEQTVGLLVESETGFAGPKNGWSGSATFAVNVVNDSADGALTRSVSAFDLSMGVSLTTIDQTYAAAIYSAAERSEVFSLELESGAIGGLLTVDFGDSLRASIPVEYRHYFGVATAEHADQLNSEFRVGLSLGYLFQ